MKKIHLSVIFFLIGLIVGGTILFCFNKLNSKGYSLVFNDNYTERNNFKFKLPKYADITDIGDIFTIKGIYGAEIIIGTFQTTEDVTFNNVIDLTNKEILKKNTFDFIYRSVKHVKTNHYNKEEKSTFDLSIGREEDYTREVKIGRNKVLTATGRLLLDWIEPMVPSRVSEQLKANYIIKEKDGKYYVGFVIAIINSSEDGVAELTTKTLNDITKTFK